MHPGLRAWFEMAAAQCRTLLVGRSWRRWGQVRELPVTISPIMSEVTWIWHGCVSGCFRIYRSGLCGPGKSCLEASRILDPFFWHAHITITYNYSILFGWWVISHNPNILKSIFSWLNRPFGGPDFHPYPGSGARLCSRDCRGARGAQRPQELWSRSVDGMGSKSGSTGQLKHAHSIPTIPNNPPTNCQQSSPESSDSGPIWWNQETCYLQILQ